MERSLAKLDTKVKSSTGIMNSSFASAAKSIGGVVSVMAIGQAGKELLDFSKELETALIEVATISNDVAGNMEEYKNSLLGISVQEDLAASSAKELAEAYYDVVSAGYDGAEGLQVLEASARAGTAGFVEVATAADGITTVLNAWGKTASEAGAVSDIFFKTVEKGKTTFPELGANINQVAPLAASLGVSFEEVTAAVATITKQGVPTSQAFTQIRSALVGMNEALGDGWAESMTLQEAMQSIYDTAGGSATEIQTLVGRVEGMSAILATSGKNALGAASDLEAMSTALGATSTAAERVTETTEYKVKLMKNSILAALEPLGTEFNKTFGEIAQRIADGFKSGDIQAFASAVTSLTKAFIAYKVSVIAMAQINKLKSVEFLASSNAEISAMEVKKIKILDLLKTELLAQESSQKASIAKVAIYNRDISSISAKIASEKLLFTQELANKNAANARIIQQKISNLENEKASLITAKKTATIASNTIQNKINTTQSKINTAQTELSTIVDNKASIAKSKLKRASIGLGKGIKSLTAAFKANPIGFIITGLMAAAAAIDYFSGATKRQRESLKVSTDELLAFNKEQQTAEKLTKNLSEEYVQLAKKTNKTTQEVKRLEAIEKILQGNHENLIESSDDFATKLSKIEGEGLKADKTLKGLISTQKTLMQVQAQIAQEEAEDAVSTAYSNFNGTLGVGGMLASKFFGIADGVNESDIKRLKTYTELSKGYSAHVDASSNRQALKLDATKVAAQIVLKDTERLQDVLDDIDALETKINKKRTNLAEAKASAFYTKEYGERMTDEIEGLTEIRDLYKEAIPELSEYVAASDKLAKTKKTLADLKAEKKAAEETLELEKKLALLEKKNKKKLLTEDEKKERVKLLQQQKAYELEKLRLVGASKEEIFNKTKELDEGIFAAQVLANEKTLLEQKTFLLEQKRLYNEFYADLAKSKELVDNDSAIGKSGEDQIFKVRGSGTGTGKGTVLVPKNTIETDDFTAESFDFTAETDDSTAESFDKVTDSAKILSEVFRSMETDLGDVLANLTVSVAQLYDGFDKDGTTAGKISGIISLVTVLGTEINKKVVENYDKAAVSLGKVSKEQSSLLSIQAAYNKLLEERNQLELNASAFYDATYTDQYQNALANSLTAQEAYNKSMASLQGNLVITAEGTGKSLLGVSEKSKEYSFTMQELAEQNSGYDSVFRQKTREAYQFQADPLDLFGGVANEEAYIDAYNNASKGVNLALESMGKTSGDMANFSQEEWSDFYTLLDSGGYIADEGTRNLIATMKTAQDEYQSALEQMKQVIKDVAGELGNDLSDSLISSMQNGTDALLEFEGGFNDVLVRMAKATAQQRFFQGLFDTLQQEMSDSFDVDSANYDANWQDDLLRFRANLPDAITGAQEFFKAVDSELQAIGLQGITGENELGTTSTTVGAIRQEITEQTGSELVGRVGAIMLSNEEIRINSYEMLEYATQNLVLMNKIVTNTDFLPEIAANTKKTADALR